MRKIISTILLVLSVFCVIMGVSKYIEEKNAGTGYENLRALAKQKVEETEVSTSPLNSQEEISVFDGEVSLKEGEKEPSRVTVSYDDSLVIPIDFDALQEINKDIYAWIEVAGTNVDYPILQNEEDNTLYLDHSVEKKKAVEGAIFTETYNNKDFEDPNTVIYGHNMKNGTMFQGLHSFSDRQFFNENKDVTVYMPDQIRHYEVFAAYVYDSRHILETYDFSDERIYEYYLREIMSQRDMSSFVDSSYGLNTTDKILTLSTCYKGIASKRFLVQAVLVSIENKI